MIIIKIIILYFIQIRHTDDFPPTGTPASQYNDAMPETLFVAHSNVEEKWCREEHESASVEVVSQNSCYEWLYAIDDEELRSQEYETLRVVGVPSSTCIRNMRK